jgi:parallel beta-helix repeat protein
VSLQYVTLVPGYVDGAGEPVRQGKVIFTPVSVLLAAPENLVVTQSPVVLDLSTAVTYVTLLATDNADLNPGTWAWEVQPLFPGAPPGQQVFLNYADGATQYLADLQPAVGAGSLGEGATIAGTVILNGTPPLQIQAGAAAGDVLASDASGSASWASLGAVGAATAAALSAETTRAEAAESAETSRAQAAETLAAQKAANLGDLANAATARTNLGLTGAATASLPLSILNGGTGSGTQPFVDLTTGQSIAGVKTFTGEVVVPAPVNPNDAATKSYADAIAQGLQVKGTVREATAGALPSYTATSSTLTASANGALTVDGASVSNGDRILVKDETSGNAPNNGIFTVTAAGSGGAPWILDRAADMDSGTEVPSAFTFVQAGSTNDLTGWVCTITGAVTLGTTAITWAQFSAAGSVTAGAGLAQSGSTISVENSGVLTVPHGGTGAGTQQAAIDALTGTQSAGTVLRSDGTHATLAAIQAGDLPTLAYVPGLAVTAFGAKGDGIAMHGAGAAAITTSSAVLTLPGLSAPATPSPANSGSGGTVTAGTYQVKITYTSAYGETLPSSAGSTTTSGSTSTITIPSPAATDGASGWYAYVTQAGGSTYTRQQPSGGPSFTGTSLVLTAPPTNTGANPPGSNTSMPSLFASTDVGKNIVVSGAGAAGANLVTTIATFTSATQVSLAANAATTVTASAFTYYTQVDSSSVQNAVTAALAVAGKSGGATLYFPPGGYVMSGVTFGSRITVQGAGKDATFFIMDPAATTGSVVCRVGPAGTAVTTMTLRDLTIDGNKQMWDPAGSQKGYGYYLGSAVTNQISQCQVINVKVRNCLTYGIDVERAQYTSLLRCDVHDCGFVSGGVVQGTNHNADGFTLIGDDITATDCRAWNNAVQGFRCGQSAAVWHRVQVVGCQAWANASKGISLGSDTTPGDALYGSSVTGGTYFSNGDAGIYLTSNAISCTVSGATAYNNATNGILLNGALYCTVTGNTLRDNATAGSSNPEIYLSSSSAHNAVTGNTISSANAANAVKEQNSSSDFNTVTGNNVTSTSATIVLAGTHSLTAANAGFDPPYAPLQV